MRGNITRRGKSSWRLKFDLERDPLTGERRVHVSTVRGTKRDAERELAKLIHAAESGTYVAPDKVTVALFLDRWERDWAAINVSPKTMERYRELLAKHVRPRLGALPVQKLRPVDLAKLYAELLTGLAPRTVGHVHRVLHRALTHAVQWGIVVQNAASGVTPPKVESVELEILDINQIGVMLKAMRGRALYLIASFAVATGMRRGEILALRWKDVDLDGALARVEQSLEQTKAGLRFKSPKTKAGRRTIALSAWTVADLRAHRRDQLEQRVALGLGKMPDDALVFANWDGTPRSPNAVTKEWTRTCALLNLPRVTLHALRHTHASQLIASGLDVLTISRRLGHGSPTITLSVYGHLFANTDEKAAAVIDAAFGAIGTE